MAEANYGIFGDDFSLEGTNPASGLNSISDSSVSFGGGGGGGVVSTPDNVVIPITTNPNAYGTINANSNLIVNIKANQESQIYVNSENTFRTTTDKLDVSLNDLLKFGSKTITVDKTGFKSNEKYVFRAVPNLNFNFSNLNFNINLADSLVGYQTRLLPNYNEPLVGSNEPIYTNTPPFELIVEYYKDDVIQSFPFNTSNQIIDIDFNLEKSNVVVDIPTSDETVSIKIEIDGIADSVLYTNGTISDTLTIQKVYTYTEKIGTPISISSSDLTSYTISKILVIGADGKSEEILPDLEDSILARSTRPKSISLTFDADSNKKISITTTEAPTVRAIPLIDFVNKEGVKKYNINEKSDIPIGVFKNKEVSDIAIYIGDNVYKYSNLRDGATSAVVAIPASAINNIGSYKVILVPSTTKKVGVSLLSGPTGSDGNPIEFVLNVVNEVYVGIPDIRNIAYPSELFGPDFVGTDVNFQISYDSINTDYVRLYNGTNFTQLKSSGNISLNVKELMQLSGDNVAEDNNNIVFNLKLIPYNISGIETVIGKEEFITIKFVKSNYTIPRNVAINRIAEAFINQFDRSLLRNSPSKYLSHLLHFGEGDNKLITTWTGSQNSLIVKLYEPLPTSVQDNQQVWISKILANPIIDTIRLIGDTTQDCPPLKGPNFGLEVDNGIGYQVFDNLISSGSFSSNLLINKYAQSKGIDTTKLNIEYVKDSEYSWENFINFGSAEERVNNFIYKLGILEKYIVEYQQLTEQTFNVGYVLTEDGLGTLTPEIEGNEIITTEDSLDMEFEVAINYGKYSIDESGVLLNKINTIIQNFDGFERFLYTSTNSLAYPKFDVTFQDSIVRKVNYLTTTDESKIWYNTIVAAAEHYDKYNTNYLVNNLPLFIQEDYDNNDFIVFLDMIGQHFDIIWTYITSLRDNKKIGEAQSKNIINSVVGPMLESLGWNNKRAFNSNLLWEYVYGTNREGNQIYSMPLEEANNQVWRRILNNLPYILKHKGTGRAMKAIMACYGVPQSMLTIMEFGGPQDPTKDATTKFTFDDRTSALFLTGSLNANGGGSSNVKIPWHTTAQTGDYPNCLEFRILPSKLPTTKYSLVSGSEWSLDLVKTTGSFGKLELNFGGDQSTSTYFDEPFISGSPAVSTVYIEYIDDEPYAYGPDLKTGSLDFPISTENYSNVLINRHNNPDSSSWFEVWYATTNGQRITTFVSMSIQTDDTQWETGSFLQIGGDGYEGTLDEFRLWEVPLNRNKFENHTLFPDAINGNSHTASTADLIFRLDFEYPINLHKGTSTVPAKSIKNVSINESYGESYAYVNNMYSASVYPYQYIPYDRTVTAIVPSLGFNVSNKIRFEEQTLIGDLSYKTRATQKSFDRAPIDSNRLGLFFSPIKELNMDILKAFGDFNIDNYIGDPSDEYKDSYKELSVLRNYYFERLDRNIYEYIQLIRYIDKSLFDVLDDLAPARAKVSKGLLIEPHYLERSKIKWTKPESERNDFDTTIPTFAGVSIDSTYDYNEGNLNVEEIAILESNLNNYDGIVDANTGIVLESTNPTYESIIDYNFFDILDTEYPTYPAQGSVNIECPTGASLYGEVDSFSSTQIGMDKNSLANLGYGLYAKKGNSVYRTFDDIFGNLETTGSRVSAFLVKETKAKKKKIQTGGYPATTSGPVKYTTTTTFEDKYYVSLLPFSGSISIGNDIVQVTAINGYLPTHYKFVNGLGEGLQRTFWKGSQQTLATTPDGLSPVETFTTNPNILRVAKTGRGSGEPILEVD
jgi:hypothetical protein